MTAAIIAGAALPPIAGFTAAHQMAGEIGNKPADSLGISIMVLGWAVAWGIIA